MISKISFSADMGKDNLWSAFQNTKEQPKETVTTNPINNDTDNFLGDNTQNTNKTTNWKLYITSAIAGIVLIGVGIWYYFKRCKNPIKPVKNPTPTPSAPQPTPPSAKPVSNPIQPMPNPVSIINYSFKNTVADFTNKLDYIQRHDFERFLNIQINHRPKYFEFLKNEQDLLPLEQFFALQNAKIKNNLALPNIVEIPNLSPENTSNIGKIFYKQFKTDFEKRTYLSGDAKEFLSALQDFTAKKSDNHTFMHIENFNEFLGDLHKSENKSLLETFKTLLATNEKTNVSYLTGKIDEYSNTPLKKMSIEFNEDIKKYDFERDTTTYDINCAMKKTYDITDKIFNETSSVLKITRDEIKNIIEGERSIILFKTPTPEYINDFLTNLLKHSGHYSSDFDCGTKKLANIIPKLEKIIENNNKIAARTGKINFINMLNLEKVLNQSDVNSAEYKKMQELLQTANKKYKTVFVVHSEPNSENMAELAREFGSIIKYDSPFDEKLFNKLHTEAMVRLNKSDFGYVKPEIIETYYLDMFIEEKAGAVMDTWPISGGILFRSNNSADNSKVAKSLLNTLGDLIETKKFTFDITKPNESFFQLITLAEECGKKYSQTKKRTIIEVENIDKIMLSSARNQFSDIQAGLKSFTENCSRDHHVTILVKTLHEFTDFDTACIGQQRFRTLYTGKRKRQV